MGVIILLAILFGSNLFSMQLTKQEDIPQEEDWKLSEWDEVEEGPSNPLKDQVTFSDLSKRVTYLQGLETKEKTNLHLVNNFQGKLNL